MQSLLELVVKIENIQARISELGKQRDRLDSNIYSSRMDSLCKEHQLIVKMLLNKVAAIHFKNSAFTIDNFDLVQKHD